VRRAFSYRDCESRRRPMTIAGSVFAAMLVLWTAVPGIAIAEDSPQFQPILCEPDQNDLLVESVECLERFKKFVARDGDVLRLKLENGETKVYTGNRKDCEEGTGEECRVFRLIAFYPSLQSFLVERGLYECAYYELVSRRTGGVVEFPPFRRGRQTGNILSQSM
jgi:hypothetical protein